jgi:hypothetical protein
MKTETVPYGENTETENYPQPIVGKQAAKVWFSFRDND